MEVSGFSYGSRGKKKYEGEKKIPDFFQRQFTPESFWDESAKKNQLGTMNAEILVFFKN